jgi:hypothetical protein
MVCRKFNRRAVSLARDVRPRLVQNSVQFEEKRIAEIPVFDGVAKLRAQNAS